PDLAPGPGGPDHVLPAHGAPRPPARSARWRVGVTVARVTPNPSPTDSAPPAPPPVFGRRATPVPRPLAGVTCPVLTAAIRRVEARWTRERFDDDDPDSIPRALSAHVDPVPGRDAAAGAERPRERAPAAPARPDLQRGLRAQFTHERYDRIGPGRRPAGGRPPYPAFARRAARVGVRHRPPHRGG